MATTVAQPGWSPPAVVPGRSARPVRPTPTRVRLIAATLTVALFALFALMAVTAAAFLQARARAQTVTSRAATAATAGDLYFALADLDAEAARLVLLGDGDFQSAGDGTFAGNQLSALSAYNARTAQVDADLQALAAAGGVSISTTSGTSATTSTGTGTGSTGTTTGGTGASAGSAGADTSVLAADVTQYRSVADAAIGLDEFPGVFAGSPTPTAIGFYGRAETLMHDVVLPAAEDLRQSTAAASTSAASDAHVWAMAGLIGTLALGIVTVGALVIAQRAFTRWYRRLLNPALLAATAITVALVGGAMVALSSASQDAQASGQRLTAYLQVVKIRADSYDADGAAVRSVLMPFLDWNTVTRQAAAVALELKAPSGVPGDSTQLWTDGPEADYALIHTDVENGDVASALSVETGTARHEDAFDFFDYDQGLEAISGDRLASFRQASDSLSNDLGPWLWLPWAMAGAALVLVGLGVRPRLAEYR
ncbi:hypothetical protein KDL01_39265 [Actinospica durhamensis]|uniref:Uncharacterized protein n=1 Tax=Actinospica durhamensis TaxID=1508375 RepID=A0A941IWG8_9ACTN|nr:hypothetical protein [Actinospica durhamensis]MBR7839366.1 hypothetical protein [Actinospica durhamensis]